MYSFSFALMEINLLLSKLLLTYEMEAINFSELDWEKQSKVYVMWWKPALQVRFHRRLPSQEYPQDS
jgi:hypothetical protein